MAGRLTTFGANSLLAGDPMPTTMWAKGHVGDPGVNAANNAAATTDRLQVVLGTPSGGIVACTNSDQVTGAASEEWDHITLWDHESAGDPWWVVELDPTAVILEEDVIQVQPGNITLQMLLWGA